MRKKINFKRKDCLLCGAIKNRRHQEIEALTSYQMSVVPFCN